MPVQASNVVVVDWLQGRDPFQHDSGFAAGTNLNLVQNTVECRLNIIEDFSVTCAMCFNRDACIGHVDVHHNQVISTPDTDFGRQFNTSSTV